MKKIFILICLAASLASCKKEAFQPVGDASNNMKAIAGAWKLVKVTQTDADAANKGFPYKAMDITNFFPYTTLRLTFNVTADNKPSTFAINNGTSPAITSITSGNWSVDDATAPKVITLTSGTTTETMTLGSYPNGVSSSLKVKVTRSSVDAPAKALIVYDYEFSR
jgi:hypothetical protein